MNIIDAFLNATQETQYIIVGINLLVAIFLGFFSRSGNWAVTGIVALIVYLILFYILRYLGMILPISYFLVLYVLPSLLLGFVAMFIIQLMGPSEPKSTNVFDVSIPYNGNKYLKVNIQKGVSVQGAAGSGKTASVAGHILKNMGERNVPGLIYDYKNFELVEVVQWFYRDSTIPIHAFSPHDPDRSIFLNPI